MFTLAVYVAWLQSVDGNKPFYPIELMADFKRAESLLAFVNREATAKGYVISVPAINEMFAGRKIQAIKIIRNETNLSLKEAKNIADAFQQTDRYKSYMSDQATDRLREKLTGRADNANMIGNLRYGYEDPSPMPF